MQKLTTTDWVQVIATLAIVISIGLVLLELRQGREIAEAQLISDQYALQAGLLQATLGENAADVLAKACSHPGDLTREETEVLDAWYQSKLAEIARRRQIAKLTGFYDQDATVTADLFAILGTPYGRHQWTTVSRFFEGLPEVREAAEKMLSKLGEGCAWYQVHPEYIRSQHELDVKPSPDE